MDLVRRTRVGRALLLADRRPPDQHHAPIAASAIAFDAFHLSLVPLAAFAGMVLHRLHESDMIVRPLLQASRRRPIGRPDHEGGRAALGRQRRGHRPGQHRIAFVWTTSAGLSTAMSVFEKMFNSPERPWWWRRGVAMVAIVASVAIVAAVTSVTVGIGMISARAGAIAAIVVPTLTLVGMLVAFFRISVRRGPVYTRRRVLPGVLVTVVLWSITSALFSFYVTTLSRYATLYGGLAAVAIFLFWLWLLALALLVGGEVNAQLDGLRDEMAASRAPASQEPAGDRPAREAAVSSVTRLKPLLTLAVGREGPFVKTWRPWTAAATPHRGHGRRLSLRGAAAERLHGGDQRHGQDDRRQERPEAEPQLPRAGGGGAGVAGGGAGGAHVRRTELQAACQVAMAADLRAEGSRRGGSGHPLPGRRWAMGCPVGGVGNGLPGGRDVSAPGA